jgi:hypothetical protein
MSEVTTASFALLRRDERQQLAPFADVKKPRAAKREPYILETRPRSPNSARPSTYPLSAY